MDRRLIVSLLFIFGLSSSLVRADDIDGMASVDQDKVEDLSVQKESDELDVYDQQAIAQETQKETAELQRQSKDLQNDIDQLSRESKKLSENIKKKSMTYGQTVQNYHHLSSDLKKVQSQRNHLKAEVEQLNSKVKNLNSKLATTRFEHSRLIREVHNHERSKARLNARKKQATAQLNRLQQQNQKLRREARS